MVESPRLKKASDDDDDDVTRLNEDDHSDVTEELFSYFSSCHFKCSFIL